MPADSRIGAAAMIRRVRTTIRWVLFDADGVLQTMPDGWRDLLLGQLGDEPAETLRLLFTAEQEETLTGGSFRAKVVEVLQHRGVRTDPELIVENWRRLVVDPEMTARVRQLRAAGLRCALATNQQDVRVAHMRSMPEYDGLFDEQFYSSELGLAKPDPAFFDAIVERIGVPADEVLFVDDVPANVAGAREVGIRAEHFAQHGGIAELNRILAGHGIGS